MDYATANLLWRHGRLSGALPRGILPRGNSGRHDDWRKAKKQKDQKTKSAKSTCNEFIAHSHVAIKLIIANRQIVGTVIAG